jgi:hypothetical protein
MAGQPPTNFETSSLDREKAEAHEYHENAGINDETHSPEAAAFKKKESKLVKKLDVFIAPVMFLLMLISYLDRGSEPLKHIRKGSANCRRNIGFAATQGMIEDANLKGSDLNVCQLPTACLSPLHLLTALQIAVSIFYITYILAEVRFDASDAALFDIS